MFASPPAPPCATRCRSATFAGTTNVAGLSVGAKVQTTAGPEPTYAQWVSVNAAELDPAAAIRTPGETGAAAASQTRVRAVRTCVMRAPPPVDVRSPASRFAGRSSAGNVADAALERRPVDHGARAV